MLQGGVEGSGGRLLYVVNDAGFFCSHRLAIALAAREAGYQVAVASPKSSAARLIEEAGFVFFDLPLGRGKISPSGEIVAFRRLQRIVRSYRPALVHLITSKPIIYGGLITRWYGIPAVAAVSGLGHVFIDDRPKSRLLRSFALAGYRAAMGRRGLYPIFQNRDNWDLFARTGAVGEEPTLIRGSGTDLARFDPTPAVNAVPRLVLPARMLFSKGVGEFVEAARLLRAQNVEATFALVGDPDPANPASVPRTQLQSWHDEGVVRWERFRPDIETVLRESDVVVLPSHNEGFPKTLVDAAAAGRAVVTNDVTGCRDAIVPGKTGILVRPFDVVDLARAMRELIDDRAKRLAMGAAGRQLAEQHYAIEAIAQQHLELYSKALAK